MRLPKYRYNPTTCRYEPVKPGIGIFLLPFFLLVLVCISMFIGLLVLHSVFFTTEKEAALIQENHALALHYDRIKEELMTVNASLHSLYEVDSKVEKRWVADQTPSLALARLFDQRSGNHFNGFRKQLQRTQQKTRSTLERSRMTNYILGSSLSIEESELSRLMHTPSIQPVANVELTKLASGFGMRTNPFHKGNYLHRGIDYIAPRGTPVLTTASGNVISVEKSDLQMGAGNTIAIDHGNGIITRYMHLGDILVKQGQAVTKGSVIATVGLSGGSISPHLHYEVLVNDRHVNPVYSMLEEVSSKDHVALMHLASLKNQALD